MAEKVSDYVFRYLHDTVGVKVCFMLPGGGCMHLVDSLGKSRIKYICNLHEQASAIAADAAGQYTGNLGLALVTAGPGSTNALTGVAGSWIDSTPVLILSGPAKHNELMEKRGMRQMGIQEVDTPAIMAPVTKYAVTVKDPAMIGAVLEKMGELSYKIVTPAYLDTALKGKYLRDDNSARMVDRIIEGTWMDFAEINASYTGRIINDKYLGELTSDTLASHYESKKSSVETKLADLLKIYKDL